MGYRTRYALRTADQAHDAHIRAEILKLHPIASPFCADTNWNGDSGCKWYSCENDCAKVSAENSGIEFSIYGQGDDDDDLWVMHFDAGSSVQLDMPYQEIDDMMESDIEARKARG